MDLLQPFTVDFNPLADGRLMRSLTLKAEGQSSNFVVPNREMAVSTPFIKMFETIEQLNLCICIAYNNQRIDIYKIIDGPLIQPIGMPLWLLYFLLFYLSLDLIKLD